MMISLARFLNDPNAALLIDWLLSRAYHPLSYHSSQSSLVKAGSSSLFFFSFFSLFPSALPCILYHPDPSMPRLGDDSQQELSLLEYGTQRTRRIIDGFMDFATQGNILEIAFGLM